MWFMRINKYLAQAGLGSRRSVESFIIKGQVQINGVTAKLGDDVAVGDTVLYRGQPVALDTKLVTYLVYKPKKVVSTTSDPEGRRTVTSLIPGSHRLFPVGRLDYNSEGLILLTNDGELADRLTHPRYGVEKTYRVLIRGHLTPQDRGRLEAGVKLKDGITGPATISNIKVEGGNMWLDITVREGRNHLIRRLFERFHHTVLRLIRIKLGDYVIGDLQPGQYLAI